MYPISIIANTKGSTRVKPWVKWLIIIVSIPFDLALIFGLYVYFTVNGKLEKNYSSVAPVVAIDAEVKTADVKLGERIATVRNGCVDCHGANLGGNKVMDNGAMGKIYGANITPAKLKNWSDGEIARAIRHGVGQKGQPLVLMPAHEYQNLSKSDLAALIAYIRSVPPVNQDSVPVALGPISKILIALEKAPSFIPAQIIAHENLAFPNKPKEAVTPEFGQYLAKSSCAGCHGSTMAGGPIPGGDPSWPPAADLTPKALGTWNEAGFIKTMREGVNPQGKKLGLPMPIAMTSKMSDLELKAMWAYLKTVK